MDHNPHLALAVRGTMAVLLLAVAVFMLALAFDLYTPESGQLRAPKWIVGISGLMFAGGGMAVLFPDNQVLGWAIAMLILACATATSLWVGLFANPDGISGGLPLLSQATNTRIGRVAFTVSGILCLALLLWGLKLGPHRQRRD